MGETMETGKIKLLAMTVLAACSCGVGATTYYVSTTGSDSNAGTSWDTAFATPWKGFRAIHNNNRKDTLIIGAGHYLLTDACACQANEVGDEIRGETGDPADVILDAQGDFEVMRLSGNALVHGLTISNGCNYGRSCYASGVRVGSDASGSATTVSIVSNCVISGCYNAFTNGHKYVGSAAYVYADGLLVDCTVRGNEAAWRGAGVALVGDKAEARGCVIEQNISTNDGIAGVWGMSSVYGGTMGGRLVDCVVQTNYGNYATGVIYVRYMEGCTVRGNEIIKPGHSSCGALLGSQAGFVVTNCTFEGNMNTGGWAAGVNVNNPGTFVDSRFIGNISGGRTHTANEGSSEYGAAGMLVAMWDAASTVRVERCEFANNAVLDTSYTGGGIQVFNGVAELCDCVISNNTAWRGGGIAVNNGGRLVMRDTLLRDNRGTVGGGVVMELAAKASMDGCTFEANASTNSSIQDHIGGGGVFLYRQSGQNGFCSVSNCVFAGNTSLCRAGGMGNSWQGTALGEVVNCVFTNNTSVRQGGGLVIRENADNTHDQPFVVRNSLFAFNKSLGDGTSDANGGGVHFVSYNDVILDSCTIVSNDSGHTMSGGVHHRWGGTITNCIIAFNTVKGKPEPTTTSAWSMDASCFQTCCIWPAVTSKFLASNGCVNADPLFTDADAADFTLTSASPCKHTGLLEDWMSGATDLAGAPRVFGSAPDIGCYERLYPIGATIIVR